MEVIGFSAAEFPHDFFRPKKKANQNHLFLLLLFLWTLFLMDISFLRVLMLDGTASQLLLQMRVTINYISEIKSK